MTMNKLIHWTNQIFYHQPKTVAESQLTAWQSAESHASSANQRVQHSNSISSEIYIYCNALFWHEFPTAVHGEPLSILIGICNSLINSLPFMRVDVHDTCNFRRHSHSVSAGWPFGSTAAAANSTNWWQWGEVEALNNSLRELENLVFRWRVKLLSMFDTTRRQHTI